MNSHNDVFTVMPTTSSAGMLTKYNSNPFFGQQQQQYHHQQQQQPMHQTNHLQIRNEILLTTPFYQPTQMTMASMPTMSSAVLPSKSPSSSSSSSGPLILPTNSTVVIGKGRVPKKAPGNRNLRTLVQAKVQDYFNAKSKMVKSSIVTDIYFSIEEACSKEGTAAPFVRYDGYGYSKTSESIAREKITSTFRDCLHDKYKSSSKNKVAKRRIANREKAEKRRESLRQKHQLDHVTSSSGSGRATTTTTTPASDAVAQQPPARVASADECTSSSSSPATVPSSMMPLQQPTQKLGNRFFSSDQISKLSRIGTFSAPLIEFFKPVDKDFFDSIEPIPIPELDCASTCSSSSSSYQSCSYSADGF